jgi:hypothetical protein
MYVYRISTSFVQTHKKWITLSRRRKKEAKKKLAETGITASQCGSFASQTDQYNKPGSKKAITCRIFLPLALHLSIGIIYRFYLGLTKALAHQ